MIFLDTNVVAEGMKRAPNHMVMRLLSMHDAQLSLSTLVIGEIYFGIEKIRPEERSYRRATALLNWRNRFADRIFEYGDEAALRYGALMGKAGRSGVVISAPDGMIAAIALRHDARLATRNIQDFTATGVELVNPWNE